MSAPQEGWWAGVNEEFMNICGPVATREAAIAEGRRHQNGDQFWICNAVMHCWAAPDAQTVIDNHVESSDELFFEDSFDGFDGTPEDEQRAVEDLETVLAAWFERHHHIYPSPTAFSSMWDLERIDGPTPLGWKWWAGPNSEEFTWGFYPSREAAICMGNGHCTNPDDKFWIVEALVEDATPDEDGMFTFVAQRDLQCVDAE